MDAISELTSEILFRRRSLGDEALPNMCIAKCITTESHILPLRTLVDVDWDGIKVKPVAYKGRPSRLVRPGSPLVKTDSNTESQHMPIESGPITICTSMWQKMHNSNDHEADKSGPLDG